MSGLGTGQETILIWWYQNHLEDTLSPKKGYKLYVEEEDYDGEQVTFNNLLQKLYKKGLHSYSDKPMSNLLPSLNAP